MVDDLDLAGSCPGRINAVGVPWHGVLLGDGLLRTDSGHFVDAYIPDSADTWLVAFDDLPDPPEPTESEAAQGMSWEKHAILTGTQRVYWQSGIRQIAIGRHVHVFRSDSGRAWLVALVPDPEQQSVRVRAVKFEAATEVDFSLVPIVDVGVGGWPISAGDYLSLGSYPSPDGRKVAFLLQRGGTSEPRGGVWEVELSAAGNEPPSASVRVVIAASEMESVEGYSGQSVIGLAKTVVQNHALTNVEEAITPTGDDSRVYRVTVTRVFELVNPSIAVVSHNYSHWQRREEFVAAWYNSNNELEIITRESRWDYTQQGSDPVDNTSHFPFEDTRSAEAAQTFSSLTGWSPNVFPVLPDAPYPAQFSGGGPYEKTLTVTHSIKRNDAPVVSRSEVFFGEPGNPSSADWARENLGVDSIRFGGFRWFSGSNNCVGIAHDGSAFLVTPVGEHILAIPSNTIAWPPPAAAGTIFADSIPLIDAWVAVDPLSGAIATGHGSSFK